MRFIFKYSFLYHFPRFLMDPSSKFLTNKQIQIQHRKKEKKGLKMLKRNEGYIICQKYSAKIKKRVKAVEQTHSISCLHDTEAHAFFAMSWKLYKFFHRDC